jgi:hypothetical protein
VTARALWVRAAMLAVIALAAIVHRAWIKAHPPTPEPLPKVSGFWKPTPESRLGGDSTFEFRYERRQVPEMGPYRVDSREGTITNDSPAGPIVRIRFTRAERESIKHAVLVSGFFDWPKVLGTPQPVHYVPRTVDETTLFVRAGVLEHEVRRFDRFGRDDEPSENREAKRLMTELSDLIEGVVEAKPEVRKLPPPPITF